MNNNNIGSASPLDMSLPLVTGTSVGYGFDVLQPQARLTSSFDTSNYKAYTIQPHDTLWDISAKETGIPTHWKQFRESDGSDFTSEEARRLQIGSTVYIPKDLLTGYVPVEVKASISSSPHAPVTSESSLVPTDDYITLSIQPQDTLWNIAKEKLGDPQDWIAILEDDGTNFTEDEAKRLRVGSTVYLPKKLIISSQKNEESHNVLITPTPELQTYFDSIQSGTKLVEDRANLSKNGAEDALTLPSKPLSPFVQPNFGFNVKLDSVIEGKNFDTGLVNAVVADDGIEGKFSFEFDSSPKSNEVGHVPSPFKRNPDRSIVFDPDYAPVWNRDVTKDVGNIFTGKWKDVVNDAFKDLETDIFANLLKWKPSRLNEGTGLSLKVGEWNGLDMWLSEADGKMFDPKHGAPTTHLKMTVEGDLTDALRKKYPSEEWVKRLGMTKVKVELAYDAEVAWRLRPIPKPLTPEPVPVRVNDPTPVYTQPQQPVGISNPFPVQEPVRQPEIPPVEVHNPLSMTNFEEKPQDQPAKAPGSSPVVTDSSKNPDLVNAGHEVSGSSRLQDAAMNTAMVLGVGALAVGAVAAVVTAPAWILPAAGATAVIGLATLPLWNSDQGEKL